MASLVVGAIGVVYGDIGTSPLYAVAESFGEAGGLLPSEPTVLGVLSLIFWTIVLIVTVKYVALVMRADNRGEGGVLSLGALALHSTGSAARLRHVVLVLSMLGLALFFGDGLITPAISVLSAMEGLNIATPVFEPYVVPLATAVLVGLFLIQSHGTERVARLFGPVMCLWFLTLALLGILQIAETPSILRALDPRHAIDFFQAYGWGAFVALGAIVLAVTGAEALYPDMGHFGRSPIRLAWLGIVLPALVLNYFGQGALILMDPTATDHPFYRLAPSWVLYPMVVLATLATIIASQAIISGVFSLTRQAIQLGNLPRMAVRHTSESEIGQIYIPRMNWLLMCGVLLFVVSFRSSGNLAAAYGISVTGVMSITAVLAGLVAWGLWGWGWLLAVFVFGALLIVDLAFFAANSLKILSGGWFPLMVAAVCFIIVATWRRGRGVLFQRLYGDALPMRLFLENIDRSAIERVAGTAVYMTSDPLTVPNALLHNLKHNKVLHQRVVLMTVFVEDIPRVRESQRVDVDRLGKGFFTVLARFGFMEEPDVPRALDLCRGYGLAFDLMETSFFPGRETLVPMSPELRETTTDNVLKPWQETLFIAMSATAQSATAFFQMPPNRVVELGAQVEI